MGEPADADELHVKGGLTRDESVLLARYCAAKLILHQIEWAFRAKYVVAAVVAILLLTSTSVWARAIAAVLLLVCAVLAIGDRVLSRLLARFGRFERLREFDRLSTGIVQRFRAQLEAHQSRSRVRRLIVTVIRYSRGKTAAIAATESLFGLDWRLLFPPDELQNARAALAAAARASSSKTRPA